MLASVALRSTPPGPPSALRSQHVEDTIKRGGSDDVVRLSSPETSCSALTSFAHAAVGSDQSARRQAQSPIERSCESSACSPGSEHPCKRCAVGTCGDVPSRGFSHSCQAQIAGSRTPSASFRRPGRRTNFRVACAVGEPASQAPRAASSRSRESCGWRTWRRTSTCPWRCQTVLRAGLQLRHGHRAQFSRRHPAALRYG